MKHFFLTVLLCLFCSGIFAQPGKDGTLTVTGSSVVLNKYSPVTADIAAGSSALTAIVHSTFFPICAGDLIMVYQAQGAAITASNGSGYGNITAYNSAGLYEFKYVQSVSGNVITTQTSFTNSYQAAGKVQVVKVPQHTTLTVNAGASISARAWHDTIISSVLYRFGGLVVLHASNIVNTGSITASSCGFRGGASYYSAGIHFGVTAFVSTQNFEGGEKGESIAGYQTDYDAIGGRYCMGAPANGGGGGDGHNAGGGGGANGNSGSAWSGQGIMIVNPSNPIAAWSLSAGYAANGNALTTSSGGGHGGYSYGDANANALVQGPGNGAWVGDTRREVGGVGGRPLTSINADTRIFFGGGGGFSHADNSPAAPPATSGGGIVYIIAVTSISSTGAILANAANVGNSSYCHCDGLAGAGAGGSIVVKTSFASTQDLRANGGSGGNQLLPVSPSNMNESEGPGGGGGGGFIAIPFGPGNSAQVNGGLNGTSLSNAVAGEMTSNGATQGAQGHTVASTPGFIAFLPLATSGTTTAGSNAPVCAGGTLSFTTTAGSSYSWTGPNGFTASVQNPSIANSTTLMAGTYSITVSGGSGLCPMPLTATTTVSFSPPPVLSVSNASICAGSTGTLTASGLSTYTWYPAAVSGSMFTASPAGTTSYSVTGTSTAGCTASGTATIVINPAPALSFTPSAISCASLGSATVSAGAGSYSYSWTPTAQTGSVAANLYPATYTVTVLDNGTGCTNTASATFASSTPFSGTVLPTGSITCSGLATGTAAIALSGGSGSQSYAWSNAPGADQTTAIAMNLHGGAHTVTVTDAVTFCSVIKTFTIAAPAPLTLTAAASQPTACTGSTIVLTATAAGGAPGYTYSWTPSGSTAAANPVSYTTAGSYTYAVTVHDANNCTGTQTIALGFINTPTVTATSATLCAGMAATLTAAGAGSYTWQPGSGSGSTLTVSPATSTAYTVSGNLLGCVASATAFVTVMPMPAASVTASQPVCSGQGIYLTGSGNGSYLWSGPAGFTSTLQNPVINAATSSNSGLYTLLVTSLASCTATASVQIAVLPNPAPVAIGATVCVGETAILNASGGLSYAWSGPAGFAASQAGAVITGATPGAAGSYTVIVTGANTCTSAAVAQLAVGNFNLPTPTITAQSVACINSKINMQGSGGNTYLWLGPGGFTSTAQNPGFVVTGPGMSGIYTLTVKSDHNCTGTATVMVTVYPQPKGSLISKGLEFCVPACRDLQLKPGTNLAPVMGATLQVNGQAFADTLINYCFKTAGKYTITAAFKDTNRCVNTASLLINAFDKPVADFEFYPQEPLAGSDQVLFTNTSAGEAQTAWYWFFISNAGDTVKTRNASHLFPETGSYPVAMIVKNKWGCLDTAIKVLNIGDEFSFYVPNAFTPNNNDGINDFFQPKGVGIIKYQLQIFDRWGEKLFETKDFYTGWDGTYKGKNCTDDTYVWKINVTLHGGRLKTYTGFVQLIR